MSPRSKLITIIASFITAAAIIGGAMFYIITYMGTYMDNVDTISDLSGTQSDIDMMHDAIRADIILSQTGATVTDDVNSHTSNILEGMDKAAQIAKKYSPEMEKLIADAHPDVKLYAAMAKDVLAQKADVQTQFFPLFSKLEKSLGAMGDAIQVAQEDLSKGAHAGLQKMQLFLIALLVSMAIAGIIFAITEYHRGVKALEENAKIAALNRSMGSIEFSLNGKVINANDNFLNLFGYNLKEAIDQDHNVFVAPEEKNAPSNKEFWNKLSHGHFQAGEYHRVARDGSDIWIQASYNPILDASGKVFKIVKFATDITAQVKLRQQNENVKNIVAENISTVSNSVTETQGIVASVSKGANELTHSVQDIAHNMGQSRDAIGRVVELSATANLAVQELSQASESMNSVAELIQNIASQISLLALNAAIEAARAGDAGRGFAVVSDEVKKLAEQTSSATTDISAEIQKMQQITGRVVFSLGEISNSVSSVSDSINSVASATEEQSSVSTSIARSMQEVQSAVLAINASVSNIAQSTGNS